ncbi:hypothetical protein HMPREF9193_00541 [Treponema lecithinolyticum ATCC 700332]|uniref:Uncharacterized protein n=1 Tax=Treponema lecithinolyticum ATCC 700332 TaxID=1321815 RepID=A0ABN0P0Q6_TRELE|nr:hypothetical protein HMPREF9193_00541 [Treponema lecithinolyticum ATCC 700332]
MRRLLSALRSKPGFFYFKGDWRRQSLKYYHKSADLKNRKICGTIRRTSFLIIALLADLLYNHYYEKNGERR